MIDKILVIFEALPQVQTGAELPEWFRVVPAGEDMPLLDNIVPSFSAGPEDFAAMIRAFVARHLDMVIDYEHQTLKGVQAPAAGWIKDLEARPDGLWAKAEWNPRAREYLQNREYRYFSPVLQLDAKTQRPVNIRSVALTNTPSIIGLEPLVAKAGETEADRAQAAAMIKQEEEAMKKEIILLLGLSAEATDAEVLAAVKPRLAQAAALPKIAGVLALKAEAAPVEIIAALTAQAAFAQDLPLIAQAVGLEGNISPSLVVGRIAAFKAAAEGAEATRQELLTLKAQQAKERAEGMVAEALRTGRTSPEELDRNGGVIRSLALADGEMFKTMILCRAEGSVVPIHQIPKQPGSGKDAAGLTLDETLVCKSLGLTAEAFKAEQKRLAEQAG